MCYHPRLPRSILLVFRGTQPVHELSEELEVHRPGPDDASECPKILFTYSTGYRCTHIFRGVRSALYCFPLATWWFKHLPSNAPPPGKRTTFHQLPSSLVTSEYFVYYIPPALSVMSEYYLYCLPCFSAPVRALPPSRPYPPRRVVCFAFFTC